MSLALGHPPGCTGARNYCEMNLQKKKTLFHVTEMRSSKKITPKTFFFVILGIRNEYVICNFREIEKNRVTEM